MNWRRYGSVECEPIQTSRGASVGPCVLTGYRPGSTTVGTTVTDRPSSRKIPARYSLPATTWSMIPAVARNRGTGAPARQPAHRAVVVHDGVIDVVEDPARRAAQQPGFERVEQFSLQEDGVVSGGRLEQAPPGEPGAGRSCTSSSNPRAARSGTIAAMRTRNEACLRLLARTRIRRIRMPSVLGNCPHDTLLAVASLASWEH